MYLDKTEYQYKGYIRFSHLACEAAVPHVAQSRYLMKFFLWMQNRSVPYDLLSPENLCLLQALPLVFSSGGYLSEYPMEGSCLYKRKASDIDSASTSFSSLFDSYHLPQTLFGQIPTAFHMLYVLSSADCLPTF